MVSKLPRSRSTNFLEILRGGTLGGLPAGDGGRAALAPRLAGQSGAASRWDKKQGLVQAKSNDMTTSSTLDPYWYLCVS